MSQRGARLLDWLSRRINVTEVFSFFAAYGLFYSEVDTRKPLREALAEALAKPVPSYGRWPRILGLFSLVLILIEIVTGALLALYYLPTPQEVNDAIRVRVQQAGVPDESIAMGDRGLFRDEAFQRTTALVNTRPMRTHAWSGVGSLIKNYITFVPVPGKYHGNACEKLGAIWHLPHVTGKTRLNILVMLTPLFHGIGPHHFSSRYMWRYYGLIVSTDPVAADATGARIIQAKRDAFFGEKRPISPPPTHIVAADTKFGLGNSHPDRIQLIKLGWEKDILI